MFLVMTPRGARLERVLFDPEPHESPTVVALLDHAPITRSNPSGFRPGESTRMHDRAQRPGEGPRKSTRKLEHGKTYPSHGARAGARRMRQAARDERARA